MKRPTMKGLATAAAMMALWGCTDTFCIDVSTGDRYGFRTWSWDSEMVKVCADLKARADYYGWGARTQYPADVYHRIEVVMYDAGSDVSQTNILKRARYWIKGEKKRGETER